MNTTNAAVLAGVITVTGRWSEGDDFDVRIAVGVIFLALMLSAMPEKIGKPFAYLIVAAVLFRYGAGIVNRTGITETRGSHRRKPPKPQTVIPGHVFRPKGGQS